MELMMVFNTLSLLGALIFFVHLYNVLLRKPERLRAMLRKQGISGPRPTFLLGNMMEFKKALSTTEKKVVTMSTGPPVSHNCAATIYPFLQKWRKQYGEIFMFSLGNTQILSVNQADVVREIATCTSLDLGKPSYQHKDRGPLFGEGILTSNGVAWSHQRKILAPEFYMDKVKGMINLINESAIPLISSWSTMIEKEGGIAAIKIDESLRNFSGDVIARACFGSNYLRGQEIFFKLRELKEVLSKKAFSIGIPGMRYVPTKSNRVVWALEREIGTLILQVVKQRKEARYENDLLQMVLEGAQNSDISQKAIDRFIVDNCKNIYLAGYEATSVTATWCLMLLALNQEWQSRVRAEVCEICKGQNPNAEMLLKMQQLTMVINETLRLYPPGQVISREALADMKFGDIHVPKGVNLWTFAITTHTDPEIWGPDSYKFNPDRFANGTAGACKFPQLYMPFGIGPRVCLGQHMALVELKLILALLLSNFSFSLSPNYIHSPIQSFVIEPEHGVHLMVKKLL